MMSSLSSPDSGSNNRKRKRVLPRSRQQNVESVFVWGISPNATAHNIKKEEQEPKVLSNCSRGTSTLRRRAPQPPSALESLQALVPYTNDAKKTSESFHSAVKKERKGHHDKGDSGSSLCRSGMSKERNCLDNLELTVVPLAAVNRKPSKSSGSTELVVENLDYTRNKARQNGSCAEVKRQQENVDSHKQAFKRSVPAIHEDANNRESRPAIVTPPSSPDEFGNDSGTNYQKEISRDRTDSSHSQKNVRARLPGDSQDERLVTRGRKLLSSFDRSRHIDDKGSFRKRSKTSATSTDIRQRSSDEGNGASITLQSSAFQNGSLEICANETSTSSRFAASAHATDGVCFVAGNEVCRNGITNSQVLQPSASTGAVSLNDRTTCQVHPNSASRVAVSPQHQLNPASSSRVVAPPKERIRDPDIIILIDSSDDEVGEGVVDPKSASRVAVSPQHQLNPASSSRVVAPPKERIRDPDIIILIDSSDDEVGEGVVDDDIVDMGNKCIEENEVEFAEFYGAKSHLPVKNADVVATFVDKRSEECAIYFVDSFDNDAVKGVLNGGFNKFGNQYTERKMDALNNVRMSSSHLEAERAEYSDDSSILEVYSCGSNDIVEIDDSSISSSPSSNFPNDCDGFVLNNKLREKANASSPLCESNHVSTASTFQTPNDAPSGSRHQQESSSTMSSENAEGPMSNAPENRKQVDAEFVDEEANASIHTLYDKKSSSKFSGSPCSARPPSRSRFDRSSSTLLADHGHSTEKNRSRKGKHAIGRGEDMHHKNSRCRHPSYRGDHNRAHLGSRHNNQSSSSSSDEPGDQELKGGLNKSKQNSCRHGDAESTDAGCYSKKKFAKRLTSQGIRSTVSLSPNQHDETFRRSNCDSVDGQVKMSLEEKGRVNVDDKEEAGAIPASRCEGHSLKSPICRGDTRAPLFAQHRRNESSASSSDEDVDCERRNKPRRKKQGGKVFNVLTARIDTLPSRRQSQHDWSSSGSSDEHDKWEMNNKKGRTKEKEKSDVGLCRKNVRSAFFKDNDGICPHAISQHEGPSSVSSEDLDDWKEKNTLSKGKHVNREDEVKEKALSSSAFQLTSRPCPGRWHDESWSTSSGDEHDRKSVDMRRKTKQASTEDGEEPRAVSNKTFSTPLSNIPGVDRFRAPSNNRHQGDHPSPRSSDVNDETKVTRNTRNGKEGNLYNGEKDEATAAFYPTSRGLCYKARTRTRRSESSSGSSDEHGDWATSTELREGNHANGGDEEASRVVASSFDGGRSTKTAASASPGCNDTSESPCRQHFDGSSSSSSDDRCSLKKENASKKRQQVNGAVEEEVQPTHSGQPPASTRRTRLQLKGGKGEERSISVEAPLVRRNIRKKKSSNDVEDYQPSPYEQLRIEKIRRNQEYLASLGLVTIKEHLKGKRTSKQKKATGGATESTELAEESPMTKTADTTGANSLYPEQTDAEGHRQTLKINSKESKKSETVTLSKSSLRGSACDSLASIGCKESKSAVRHPDKLKGGFRPPRSQFKDSLSDIKEVRQGLRKEQKSCFFYARSGELDKSYDQLSSGRILHDGMESFETGEDPEIHQRDTGFSHISNSTECCLPVPQKIIAQHGARGKLRRCQQCVGCLRRDDCLQCKYCLAKGKKPGKSESQKLNCALRRCVAPLPPLISKDPYEEEETLEVCCNILSATGGSKVGEALLRTDVKSMFGNQGLNPIRLSQKLCGETQEQKSSENMTNKSRPLAEGGAPFIDPDDGSLSDRIVFDDMSDLEDFGTLGEINERRLSPGRTRRCSEQEAGEDTLVENRTKPLPQGPSCSGSRWDRGQTGAEFARNLISFQRSLRTTVDKDEAEFSDDDNLLFL